MKSHRSQYLEEGGEDGAKVDLSPMIDCIFILLIFFVVTTVFLDERGLQMHQQPEAGDDVSGAVQQLVVEIAADDSVAFQGAPIPLSHLSNRLQLARQQGREARLTIQVAGQSRHQMLVAVWDAARLAGIDQITFSTED